MGRKNANALLFGAIMGLCAGPAAAQLVGTYSGTQANGAPFSLTVESHNNKLYLSGLGIGITTTCPDGEAINENVGLGIEPIKIDSPKLTVKLLANPELYVSALITFDNATKSASGRVTAYVPALDEFTKRPKRSETCLSKQSFTASQNNPAEIHATPPRMVIY